MLTPEQLQRARQGGLMPDLPPHVKAYADALLAVAPPLTDEAVRAIHALSPYMPAVQPQAA